VGAVRRTKDDLRADHRRRGGRRVELRRLRLRHWAGFAAPAREAVARAAGGQLEAEATSSADSAKEGM